MIKWLEYDVRIYQGLNRPAAVESFAEYVPAPCTHRLSSHSSEVLAMLWFLPELNQNLARRAKS